MIHNKSSSSLSLAYTGSFRGTAEDLFFRPGGLPRFFFGISFFFFLASRAAASSLSCFLISGDVNSAENRLRLPAFGSGLTASHSKAQDVDALGSLLQKHPNRGEVLVLVNVGSRIQNHFRNWAQAQLQP